MATLGTAHPSWRARADALWTLAWKQLLVLTRYPVEFVGSFISLLLIIAMFTSATMLFLPPGAAANAEGESRFAGLVAYGYVLFLFAADSIWLMGAGLRREQVEGTLEALYLTPASKLAALLARVLAQLVVWDGLLALGSVFFFAWLVGRIPFHDPGLGLLALLLGLSTSLGLGLAFAAFALVAKAAAESAANFAQFALLFVCAMFFPFSALPAPVLVISRLVPLSYVVDLFRSTLVGQAPELLPAAAEWPIVVACGLLTPLAGYGLYRAAERHARRTGSLGDY